MNRAYLLIGGNMGNRQANLGKTLERIAAGCGRILDVSSVYETAAWGKTDQPDFLNQALLLETPDSPDILIRSLLAIEEALGRYRGEKYGPRIIDIDILFFNSDRIEKPDLKIPHPRIQERRFALAPMAEIAPGMIHPLLGKTMQELLDECPDPLPVRKKPSVE